MRIRKLKFDEMWELYLLLEPFLPKETKELLVDEVETIIQKIEPIVFSRILRKFSKEEEKNPMDGLLIFIRGLKENNFFMFAEFIGKLGNKEDGSRP